MIAKETYNYLEQENLLPEEQKGCERESRGTKDQLIIVKNLLKVLEKEHQPINGLDRL